MNAALKAVVDELRMTPTASLELLLAINVAEYALFRSRGGDGTSDECANANMMFVLYEEVLEKRSRSAIRARPLEVVRD
jgi:hypothetical protein